MPLYYHKDLPVSKRILRLTHPSWSVLINKLMEKFLTASDLKELAEVSYRQINDWEERKYIVSDRGSDKEWRKFSILELIGFTLLKEIKKHGIPIAKIRNILDYSRLRIILIERIPEFVKGRDYWLWTDFYRYIWISENAPRKIISTDPAGDPYRLQGFKNSQILIGIPVKTIIDRLVKKLNFDDFKVKIEKDGSYSFVVNGVPLTLEDMPLEDSTKEYEYLLKGVLPRSVRRKMGVE